MVALTLSLILLGGVLAVMYSSKVTYMENERVGRLQENGRAALEMILRDLRGAGFPGCAQPIEGLFEMNNTLANPDRGCLESRGSRRLGSKASGGNVGAGPRYGPHCRTRRLATTSSSCARFPSAPRPCACRPS